MIRATFLVVGVLVAGCGREVANERDAIAPVAEGEVRSEPLQELFARHVLSSFVKQLRLADVVRDESWQFDKASGTLRFGDSIEYRVQVLGTESHGSDTWLWAWANEASKIPPGHLVAANRLRTFGHEQGIDELTTAMVSLDILDGHTAGMIASGVAVGNAYFRCPYEGGAMFVLITDPLTDSPVEADVIRTTRAIAEAFSNFEISNQRQVMLAYLRQRGIEVQVEGQTVQAVSEGKPWFTAEFDESNRLTSIKATTALLLALFDAVSPDWRASGGNRSHGAAQTQTDEPGECDRDVSPRGSALSAARGFAWTDDWRGIPSPDGRFMIIPLSSAETKVDLAGGKGAALAKLIRSQVPVPSGFLVGIDVYATYLAENGIAPRLPAMLAGIAPDDLSELEAASRRIRSEFSSSRLSDEAVRAIGIGYCELRELIACDEPPLVAVRSSATCEDGPELSFAGQYETYLNVQGEAELLEAVVKCWSSLWTSRAISYRLRNGVSHDGLSIAVVVQQMVQADVSGVLFTANPLTGRRSEMVIDATRGNGDDYVSGQSNPERYIIDR
ncbi:Probable phosphoenolpyruvate synthase (PEP synthase) (Pyruvate, partial [Durusdinium trenchii]